MSTPLRRGQPRRFPDFATALIGAALALALALAWTATAGAQGLDSPRSEAVAQADPVGSQTQTQRRAVPWWRAPVPPITDGSSLLRSWTRANGRQKRIATRATRALQRAQRARAASRAAALRNATLWLRRYVVQRRALRKAWRAAAVSSAEQTDEGRELGRLQTCLAHVALHERLLQSHTRELSKWRSALARGNARAIRTGRVSSRRAAAKLTRSRRQLARCVRSARNSLTANPSFELGTAWWSAFNANLARRRDRDAPRGDWVGRVRWTEGDVYTIDDLGVSVSAAEAGGLYEARAFVKAAGAAAVGKPIRIVIRETTPTGVVRQIRGPEVPLTAAYQLLTVPVTDQTAGSSLEVLIVQFEAGPGDGFFVDRILLRRIGAAPASAG